MPKNYFFSSSKFLIFEVTFTSVFDSVSDPYSFFTDRIRIQRLRLETNTDPDRDPDPIRIQGFNDQKFTKKLQLKKKM
jgi:hypothetical protein